jgi:hypothetical protein
VTAAAAGFGRFSERKTTARYDHAKGRNRRILLLAAPSRRRSLYPIDSRRSDLAAGTGLHAPRRPFPAGLIGPSKEASTKNFSSLSRRTRVLSWQPEDHGTRVRARSPLLSLAVGCPDPRRGSATVASCRGQMRVARSCPPCAGVTNIIGRLASSLIQPDGR